MEEDHRACTMLSKTSFLLR